METGPEDVLAGEVERVLRGRQHRADAARILDRQAATGVEAEVGELLGVRDYIASNHEFAATDKAHQIELMFRCNVFAPLDLIQRCLPAWKRQGGGIVINITSAAGQTETPAPIGKGGWGLGYSITKAAFSRMIPGLAKELRPYRVAVIGLMPGFIATERTSVELREYGFDPSSGLPVENPGRVCAMLATARDPMFFSGRDLRGPEFYAEHEQVRFDDPRNV